MQKKLSLNLGRRQYVLTVGRDRNALQLSGEVDGEPLEPMAAEVECDSPWVLIRTDGVVHRCAVARDAKGVWVGHRGRTYYLESAGTKASHAPAAEAAADEVRAPMTGTMISVNVEPGARVAQGDLLAVMEAMKMEYRLEAPFDTTVAAVECKPGDMVDVGTLLVRLEPAEA